MFDYLPFPEELRKKSEMYSANSQLIYGTSTNRMNVLYYWVLCALEKDCLAPENSRVYCDFKPDRFNHSGDCHRFDQSAITILLEWAVNFEMTRISNESFAKLLLNH